MSQPGPFTVIIDPDLPATEREALLLALRTETNIQSPTTKAIDPQVVIAVIKASGEVADALVKIATLATAIYGWVQVARRHGKTPKATLQRPKQPPLDLSTVTDEKEVLEWLLQTPPKP